LVDADPFALFLGAVALSAAAAFPVITLSIWWKRLSAAGAVASMGVGFGITIVLLLANQGNVMAVPTPVAGIIAATLAIATALIVSMFTPVPDHGSLDAARDMRIPGGETVYDREMRQLRFTQRGQD
ncbi:MAG: sodium:solute symporter, partial [Alphaproteobacteria bacterium]|nr:sodium:solute symporter [Alphaproteobacteria bacterium]